MKYASTLNACKFGIISQAIVNNLIPVLFAVFKDNFGISYTRIATIMLINFTVQLFTDAISIKLIKWLNYRKAALLAQICSAVGLIFLGTLHRFMPFFPALFISACFYAFGGGLLEVLIGPIIDSLSNGKSRAKMSLIHSFYCWGQVFVVFFSSVAISFLSPKIWYILPVAWSIIPIINIFIFLFVPIPKTENEESSTQAVSMFGKKGFASLCILMLCSGAAETTMSQWASIFAQNGLGTNKLFGDVAGPCMFAFLMGCGRLFYGIFGDKLNLLKSLSISSAFCVVCYILSATSKNVYIALCGCALTGLSVSIMWPGVYSYAAEQFPGSGCALFGILALFGDVGCSVGSWLCGIISDFAAKTAFASEYVEQMRISYEQFGLKIGILFTSIFPLVMFLLLLRRKKSRM